MKKASTTGMEYRERVSNHILGGEDGQGRFPRGTDANLVLQTNYELVRHKAEGKRIPGRWRSICKMMEA